MISNVVALAFLSREVAHRAHLAAKGRKNYSEHKILGKFYVAVADAADSLTEATQGRMGAALDIPYLKRSEKAVDIADELRGYMNTIEKVRHDGDYGDDSVIQNLVDNLVAVYLSTLNLLEDPE